MFSWDKTIFRSHHANIILHKPVRDTELNRFVSDFTWESITQFPS